MAIILFLAFVILIAAGFTLLVIWDYEQKAAARQPPVGRTETPPAMDTEPTTRLDQLPAGDEGDASDKRQRSA